MSLSEHEQHVLDMLERDLAGGPPGVSPTVVVAGQRTDELRYLRRCAAMFGFALGLFTVALVVRSRTIGVIFASPALAIFLFTLLMLTAQCRRLQRQRTQGSRLP